MNASTVRRTFLAVSAVLVVVAIVGGIRLLDSPAKARARRFDARRIEDLERIEREVTGFHRDENRLPSSLAELAGRPGPPPSIRDPQTGVEYGYRVIDRNTYELCATFQLVSEDGPAYAIPGSEWKHGPGRTCFRRTVEDEATTVPKGP